MAEDGAVRETTMEWTLSARKELIFFVNGSKVVEKDPDPEMTLLYYLRNKLGLPGTKLGCNEGGCGACTVMVSRYQSQDKTIRHYSVNACIAPLCSLDGLAVTTVEGIGSVAKGLHPAQERLAAAHGSQCGFCTPGIVMSMYTLLRNTPCPSQAEMERAFDGNLCRCTGYRPILDGYKTFTKEYCCGGGAGGKCCKDETTGTIEGPFALFDPSKFKPLDPTQEPIFPPELQVDAPPDPIFIQGPLSCWQHDGEDREYQTNWVQPVTLQQLLAAKERYPKGKITVGSSEISVELAVRGWEYHVFINPSCVPELTALDVTEEGLLVGAACPLSDMGRRMQELVHQLPEYKTQTFQAVLEMLRWFAGDQIRNVASVGGNLVTASPISDLNPILMAVGATAHIASRKGGRRSATVDESFFVSYRRVAMEPDEVLVSVLIPYIKENEHVVAFKQARRREDDIAIVNACFKVALGNGAVVQSCSLVYGGRAPVTKRVSTTERSLVGLAWDGKLLEKAMETIPRDLPLDSDVPGGMPEYRQTLSMSFFYKFFTIVSSRVAKESVPQSEVNITTPFVHTPTRSSQGFQSVPSGQLADDAVGRPLPHLSANMQASGEATYVDDMPRLSNELYAGMVLSTRAHAKLLSVDASEAVAMPGVWGFVSARDVGEGESNVFRVAGVMDEPVFAEDKVICRGQLIGLVLANDKLLAQRAAKRVRISYQELPSILTIQEAIAANSFYEPDFTLKRGNVEEGFESAEHIVTGEVHIGGQEHFYLETQANVVIPKEGGEMEIFTSTQNAHVTQVMVALVTGVPANRITVRVKRLGGGFGGKETRAVPPTVALALAAKKCGRPVRLMLDRHEDMVSTGTRHPFFARYKVGCTNDGVLKAANVELYSNAGCTIDLSIGVLHRSMWHADNAYFIPNWRVVGKNCRTNVPSNTAFRGFGGPQGMLVAETFLSKVAEVCGLDPTVVRQRNLYREGDSTHFGQPLVDCHIRQCWEELAQRVDLPHWRAQVDSFNKTSRWVKRGLSVIPTKFGIAFGIRPLNQGGALVHVYTDGSVLVSHGGVEMGQGLHTKMSQVAARALGVPVERVHIGEMATSSVANSSPTAASFSADLYGLAIKDACEQIKARLSPYMEANLKGQWEDWVTAAYLDMVNLSANGFSNFPDFNFDWSVGQGIVFKYFSYGVACSEVQVDTLTGDHHVIKTDIVMDVGESLNPAIDIGQIEGGFTQGLGLFTLEEHVVLDGDEKTRGLMVTTGPGAYKIPGFSDIPRELNVSLLKAVPNKRAIYSSKAIGEPPLFLAGSVFFAIKDAIAASRRDCGATTDFTLDSPATAERIRMACADSIAESARKTVRDNGKRWNV